MTKRNPKLAALLSVIPGLGQFYNKRPIKGTIFFIFFISFISVFYSFLNIGFWGLFTLGTVPKLDDSRVLLAQGIISILLVAFAIMLYIINIYVWSSIYKLQFIQRASETHIRMGWFR